MFQALLGGTGNDKIILFYFNLERFIKVKMFQSIPAKPLTKLKLSLFVHVFFQRLYV